jgi:hypothetical protein
VKDHPKWTVGEGSVCKMLTSVAETIDTADKLASNEEMKESDGFKCCDICVRKRNILSI